MILTTGVFLPYLRLCYNTGGGNQRNEWTGRLKRVIGLRMFFDGFLLILITFFATSKEDCP